MSLRLIVKEVAEREGIRNPRELSQRSGIAYASCHRFWNGEVAQIGIETLERLCTLFKVWPNQLFDYRPEPKILPQDRSEALKATKAKRNPDSARKATKRGKTK